MELSNIKIKMGKNEAQIGDGAAALGGALKLIDSWIDPRISPEVRELGVKALLNAQMRWATPEREARLGFMPRMYLYEVVTEDFVGYMAGEDRYNLVLVDSQNRIYTTAQYGDFCYETESVNAPKILSAKRLGR